MVRVTLRTRTVTIPPQDVITRDNVTARVDAVAYFRVVDANSAVVSVEDAQKATLQIAQTTLRSVLGKADLDTLLSEREQLNEDLQQIIDEQTEPWGIKATTVEIKDVSIPAAMQKAMSRQAEAERERRARIINADAEFQAAAKLAQAAEVINAAPAGLQLRYLQTLREIAGGEQSSTIVFPLPIDLVKPLLEQINKPSADTAAPAELHNGAGVGRAAEASVVEAGRLRRPRAVVAVALVVPGAAHELPALLGGGSGRAGRLLLLAGEADGGAGERARRRRRAATTAVKARRRRRGTRGGGGVSSTEASTETSSKRSIRSDRTPAGKRRRVSCRRGRCASRGAPPALPPVARRTTLGTTHAQRGGEPVRPRHVALGLPVQPGVEDRPRAALRRRDQPARERVVVELGLREALGGDEARQHEPDVDAAGRLLAGQRVRPARERELARRVGAGARPRHAPRGARDVDDRARRAAAQQRQQRLGQPHDGVEVDLHVALDVLPAAVGERRPPRGAGVVDEQVEPARGAPRRARARARARRPRSGRRRSS